ncbi:MAG: DUF5687 family protein [Dysgonamonadaceae bacterium]|jgi:hypothetical protein|nr:DUF5687 family protein [Dysgonamonadaceae bacterium]
MRLLLSVYLLIILFFIYFFGSLVSQFISRLFSNEINAFLLLLSPLLLLDFILKICFKKDNIQFIAFSRFPNSNKTLSAYLIIKEIFSPWNYYLLFFFLSYLITSIYPYSGLLITAVIIISLCSIQILISQIVNKIKHNRINNRYIILPIHSNILSNNVTANYLSLNIKMITRSPRMRQSFLRFSLVIIAYFYLIITHKDTDSFILRFFLILITFISFPVAFNQFLFSAEAAFFDHLMTIPNFKNILSAKYTLCTFFSLITFLTLLFILPFSWKSFVELTAIFLYSAGTITLLSFCSILFVTAKIDLFGSQYKMMSNPPSVQSFSIVLINLLAISLVILISWLFSNQTATYYMLVAGALSILFRNSWFNYLYRCFYPNKYEKMELFRIQ